MAERTSTKRENVDYELVPVTYANNDQAWEVRLLTGEFCESVIRIGNIAVDGKADNLTFNFTVSSSPIPDLDPDTNVDLQNEVGETLIAIIEDSIENNALVIRDKDTKEDE